MENCARAEFNDILALRKAEDAALRRFQAAEWLQSLVGRFGISSNPSEKEFISCLRNGLILCNAINKVHPGAVPKVVENHSPVQSLTREPQPLPAYQYFENVRNFLVAVEELKLPAFDASDLERDTLEVGSAARVVDCVLALKSYHEWKQMNGGNGFYKPVKSPMVIHSASRNNSRSISSSSCRQLDMFLASEKQPPNENVQTQELEDVLVKLLAEHVADTKENIGGHLLASFRNGNMDTTKFFGRILSNILEDKLQNKFPQLNSKFRDCLKESTGSPAKSTLLPLQDKSEFGDLKCCREGRVKGNQNHKHLLQMQEKELMDLKTLLRTTKREFSDFQSQLERDMRDLGVQVQEMSTAALGYHRVLKENRNLHNMVLDLKGNIRVYCRIRPAFSAGTRNVIDFVGDDGTLVILDPAKSYKEGKKVFQFNRVFGPTSTQDEVFMDMQPLIRSVMDGYNVCIFAYGQTGSGKTYTMSGPPSGLTNDMGINYLALSDLFQISSVRKDVISYEIQVQMVEIYNEQVRDLLTDDTSANRLEIRSCAGDNSLTLPDAKLHQVKSTADVLKLMKLGELNRTFCSTAINNRSSRSHSILIVHVHGKDISGSTLRGSLHLVDLAGSERVDKSEVTGDSLKEAQFINKSLSCLGDVISALNQKNSYIPYRNSKLTLLLQDSLGGNGKTLMFAHVSPEEGTFGETVSTLKFAQRVSTIELGTARANKESSEIMQLKEQVENLRKALAMKEAQNAQFIRIKEPIPTCERPKELMLERTPPRARRLSIENGSNMKSDKPKATTERTPPRGRRLSIENGSSMKFEKPKALTERTPPRGQRLNNENGSYMKSEKKMNHEVRKGLRTPTTTGSRRLSLEGPRYGKKENFQAKVAADDESEWSKLMTQQKYGQSQDAEAMTKAYLHSSSGNSMIEVYHLNAPRSPTSSLYQKRMVKTDNGTKIPALQLPAAPEIVMQNELALSTESQPVNLLDCSSEKRSHIRKSLRTIGKLINGSEKRNQHNTKEAQSPIKGANGNNDIKSPHTANARVVRRQSLTGIPTSGSSRRSSLGGKSNDTAADDSRRNAKTPPPIHLSTKTTKRWM